MPPQSTEIPIGCHLCFQKATTQHHKINTFLLICQENPSSVPRSFGIFGDFTNFHQKTGKTHNTLPYEFFCLTQKKRIQQADAHNKRKHPPLTRRVQRIWKLSFQVDTGLLGEDMAGVAGEGELHVGTGSQSSNFGTGHVHGGND